MLTTQYGGELISPYCVDVYVCRDCSFKRRRNLLAILNSSHHSSSYSRIIAINPNGSVRWTVVLEGIVQGTPRMSTDNDTIYVSHNVANTVGEEPYRGKVTVLRDNGGSPSIVASVFPENEFGPFGPLTLKTTSTDEEVVFVAESYRNGLQFTGYVYYLAPAGDEYALEIFSEWGFSSRSAPAVGNNAGMLFVGGAGSTVGGWVGDQYSSVLSSGGSPSAPTWQDAFLQDRENENNVTIGKYS